MFVYKILRASELATLKADGETVGAPVDVEDGYVHLSAADQVAETARRYFSGETGLTLLALEANTLGDALKWEVSRGGALFPHLYAKLRLTDIAWSRDLPLVDGAHKFPESLE